MSDENINSAISLKIILRDTRQACTGRHIAKHSIDSYSRQTYAFILSVSFKSYRTFDIHLLAWFTLTVCHRMNDSPLASRLSETRDLDISPILFSVSLSTLFVGSFRFRTNQLG